MKSRDEYLASIYKKRDDKLAKQKKNISVITSAACLVICFIAVFSFIPKKIDKRTNTAEPVNANSYSNSLTIDKIISEDKTALNQFEEQFTFDAAYVINESAESVTYPAEANAEDIITSENNREDSIKTEIAIENPDDESTRKTNFGYIGEPFDPDRLLSGGPAIAPAEPPDDFGEPVTEHYTVGSTNSDVKKETKASTTAAKLKTSEEAITEALKMIPEEEVSEIIEEKTQVTITRTASGQSTYTVYFYTNIKSYEIDVDAVTLRIIECKTKNNISGKETYISPPWFPETTEALPEYKPQ